MHVDSVSEGKLQSIHFCHTCFTAFYLHFLCVSLVDFELSKKCAPLFSALFDLCIKSKLLPLLLLLEVLLKTHVQITHSAALLDMEEEKIHLEIAITFYFLVWQYPCMLFSC